MNKFKLLLFLLFAIPMAAQCAPHSGGAGTDCATPIYYNPAPGQSPTWEVIIAPATPQFPCPPAPAGKWALCGQPMPDGAKEITVDYGTGLFIPFTGPKGDKGDKGDPGVGVQGIQGVQGPQGVPGTPALQCTQANPCTFTCAHGGNGVPRFQVHGCYITQP